MRPAHLIAELVLGTRSRCGYPSCSTDPHVYPRAYARLCCRRPAGRNAIKVWLPELRKYTDPTGVPAILVGNKADKVSQVGTGP